MAKVEWHPGELYPRVSFIITNVARPAERVVAFYNQRGTAEQWIKEGKGAIKWTPLSCRAFAANAVRLQLDVLAYNLGNFMRTLAMPKAAQPWSLTSLREKLITSSSKPRVPATSRGSRRRHRPGSRGASRSPGGEQQSAPAPPASRQRCARCPAARRTAQHRRTG
jgi:Transposase DDE domain group 1